MLKEAVISMVAKPGDAPVFETPGDYGLPYKDVTFESADGVMLSGWLIGETSDKVIVQTHFGVLSSKSGYTPEGKGLLKPWPTTIHYLRHIKALVNAGYAVLAYDMRNHGDSGADPCGKVTGGVREAADVIAAVRFIADHPDFADARIGLLSLCMGANATTFAFGAEDGLAQIPNIAALIAIQPLLMIDQLHAMKIPAMLIEPASKLNQEEGGTDLHESFMSFVPRINVPTLLVQNTNDPMCNRDSIDLYFDLLEVEKEMLWVDQEKARLAAYDYFANEPEKMLSFFARYI